MPDISVCVCTFRRPVLLKRLLEAMRQQDLPGHVELEIVVVDNAPEASAEAVVREFVTAGGSPVRYVAEPSRNISIARNTALASATAPILALIDDDELPSKRWLLNALNTLEETGADGVLGPVIPEYPLGAPSWLRSLAATQRRRLTTGSRVEQRDARTGNVVLRRERIGAGPWFRPEFGRTGGEDSDFFQRQFARGLQFVWCDEAVVSEAVPTSRWTIRYHVIREWRSGSITGSAHRLGLGPSLSLRRMAREAIYAVVCTAAALPAVALPRSVGVRIWQKAAYSLALLLSAAGLSSAAERT
ncbi:succinoglycan biosynthesis protein ExoM [Luteitalea sp. TBR-22]|uniref:glycosyltransferase n=1 Tax=Luteitalea sp. TBR-22 TaxID=2802971 RepID=UPI001AF815CF|nr:glycosyltransferase family 2 protein [Luteitalea sp. TBR-22]BCS36066.1 succinoglycan biosynthesis protein ExoM [Luteitalea sp. TBR-22]